MFQIFIDFNFAILSTTFLLMSYLIVLREDAEFHVERLFMRVGPVALLFLKFFIFIAWYRWMDDGNILELTTQLFWLRFLYDLTIYAFSSYIVREVTDEDGDRLQYIFAGVMFLKEVYIYFSCVRRAERKLSEEKFNTGLQGGLQKLISRAQTGLLKEGKDE